MAEKKKILEKVNIIVLLYKFAVLPSSLSSCTCDTCRNCGCAFLNPFLCAEHIT